MTNDNPTRAPHQETRLQLVGAKRRFASTSPVIESVAERICYRFANGALERSLSIEFQTRREFIEAVIRRDYRRLREENAMLRRKVAA